MDYQDDDSLFSPTEAITYDIFDKSDSGISDIDESPQKPHSYTAFSQPPPLRPRILNSRAAEFLDSLPDPIIHNQVTHLLDLQTEKQRYREAYQAELRALENKYLQKCKPLYEERAATITGLDLSCDLENLVHGFIGPPVAIPEFWLTALQNHPSVRDIIQPWDEEALSYLLDIRMEMLPTPDLGFQLDFEFAENEYFENRVLRKVYTYERDENGGIVYDEVIGCEIFWYKGKRLPPQNFIFGLQAEYDEDEEPPESFFDFFNPPSGVPADAEELAILEMKRSIDFGFGEVFKEKIIPDAVDWFIGDAIGAEPEGGFVHHEDVDDSGIGDCIS